MAQSKKVKLGPKASSFFDPVTRLKVSPNRVVSVTPQQQKSERFTKAIAHRWLIETEDEPTAKKSADEDLKEEGEFAKMTIPQLIKYVEENYELEDEELARVKNMKKAELVEYVEDLESEEE